jgi:hypothetical protein
MGTTQVDSPAILAARTTPVLERVYRPGAMATERLQTGPATHRHGLDEVPQHASSVDGNLPSRKDRKIEDLKAELMSKTERMQRAENLVHQEGD